jgi:hypothetical protein
LQYFLAKHHGFVPTFGRSIDVGLGYSLQDVKQLQQQQPQQPRTQGLISNLSFGAAPLPQPPR